MVKAGYCTQPISLSYAFVLKCQNGYDHSFSHRRKYLFKIKRGCESFVVEVAQECSQVLAILSMIICLLSFGQLGFLT